MTMAHLADRWTSQSRTCLGLLVEVLLASKSMFWIEKLSGVRFGYLPEEPCRLLASVRFKCCLNFPFYPSELMRVILRSLQKSFCSWHQPQSLAQKLSLLSIEGRLNEAVRILHSCPDPNLLELTSETYLSLIRSCIKFKAFTHGQEIHKHMTDSGVIPNIVLRNNIMMMYSKCGNIGLARQVFEEMDERNLFSWMAMIGAYSQNGDAVKAFEFYGKMVCSGIKADCFLYPLVLKSCAAMKDLSRGQCVHTDIVRSGFQRDVVLMNSLIDMYVKCKSMVDAERAFDEMFIRDVFTWTTMLVGYVQTGRGLDALELFKEMLNSHVRPSSATLAGMLPLFSDMGCLIMAKQIHSLVTINGFEYDKCVGTALVDMYANCGGLGYGRLIFNRILEKDVSCWNTMIKRYAQANLHDESIALMKLMQLDGIYPAKSTWDCFFPQYFSSKFSIHGFLKLIKHLEHTGIRPGAFSDAFLDQICDRVENVEQVKELHLYFRRSGHISNCTVGSKLIRMYTKFADIEAAQEIFYCISLKELDCWNSIIACYAYNLCASKAFQLFNQMRKNGIVPTVVSWNTIIAGYVGVGDFEAALEMFYEMKWTDQNPDLETYSLILPIIGRLTNSMMGKQLHCMFLRTECAISKFMRTALINMYGNSGNVAYAMKLFDSMDHKDLVSWNAIISCLVKNRFLDEASRIFHEMKISGVEGNTVTWTTLVAGYARHGLIDESLKHFRELQLKGLKPNSITIASILPACARSATLSHGKSIHSYIKRNGTTSEDLFVLNALMDMYIKCGLPEYSERVFRILPQKDIVSWNTMIQGYMIHGRAKAALSFFDQMLAEGFHPDSITFAWVLSACSHAGLVDEGLKLFNNMESNYGIIPTGKHCACMVELLGCAGLFNEVRNFIFQMALQPTASLWGALLSASNLHGNVEMAEFAASHLIALQPEVAENYVMLSDIYANARRWDDFDRIKQVMADNGVKELPECTWIEIGNSIRSFTPQNFLNWDFKEELNGTLLHLMAVMIEEGYVPKTITENSTCYSEDMKSISSICMKCELMF